MERYHADNDLAGQTATDRSVWSRGVDAARADAAKDGGTTGRGKRRFERVRTRHKRCEGRRHKRCEGRRRRREGQQKEGEEVAKLTMATGERNVLQSPANNPKGECERDTKKTMAKLTDE